MRSQGGHMGMIDRNLEAIILYGAFDGNGPAHGAVKDKEQEMTNAGTDVYDRRTRNPEDNPF